MDARPDEAHAGGALHEAGASVEAQPLTLPMRLALALVFCLASDLAFQTDATELVRIDGPDVHYTAAYQGTNSVASHGLSAASSAPVR